MSAQEILSRIRDFAAERKLRPTTLARMAGLHPNALRDMNKADWHPRFDTVEKLEKVMEDCRDSQQAAQ